MRLYLSWQCSKLRKEVAEILSRQHDSRMTVTGRALSMADQRSWLGEPVQRKSLSLELVNEGLSPQRGREMGRLMEKS